MMGFKDILGYISFLIEQGWKKQKHYDYDSFSRDFCLWAIWELWLTFVNMDIH